MPHTKTQSSEELINWLRLARTQNVGKVTFFNLIKIFGSAGNALQNIEEYSLRGGREKPIKVCSSVDAEKELELCNKIGAQIIIFDDELYPKLLKEIPDAPPIITVLGDVTLLDRNVLAIVGPRNASMNGCKFAGNIAKELGVHGFVIASGLARGIDTAAHNASINSGTIAVIGGGIDNIYPPENKKLYHEIAEKGLIISENYFGAKPLASSFPQRNRIISGISLGTIVVEATLKSGTLITAACALEQNREVFAVPGSPFDPRCHGTNRLIKEGAKLIESASDVMSELILPKPNVKLMEPQAESFEGISLKISNDSEIKKIRELILSKIDHCGVAIDEIIVNLQISPRLVNIAITQLELADKIENKNGKICLK